MTPYQIIAKAKEMDIMPEAALAMRIRYLRGRIKAFMSCDELPELMVMWALKDINDVVELEKYRRKEKEVRENGITDEMIERAKSVPIETIVEFKRGRAHCINPDHADRNPSMFHGTKTNQAVCPACGKKYDSIDAYRLIWNVDFKQAVRRLQ